MTTFFAPTDLRVVDPRPTAGPSESDESVVRDLLTARLSGDDLTRALQALGLLPYERTLNPGMPANWKPARPGVTATCRNGHPRDQFSSVRNDGYARCRLCRQAYNKRKKTAA